MILIETQRHRDTEREFFSEHFCNFKTYNYFHKGSEEEVWVIFFIPLCVSMFQIKIIDVDYLSLMRMGTQTGTDKLEKYRSL